MNEHKILTFVLLVSLSLLITLAPSLNTPPTAHATIITVNSTADVAADDGQCTLREAIVSANMDIPSGVTSNECDAGVGDDTIDLTGISGTIDLSGPLPDLNSNMVLNGPGAGVLAVRRNSGGNYRIFMVGSGATVIISGLTVREGLVVGEWGGGILNIGTLTLTHSVVIGNSSDLDGGGIFSMHRLTLDNSTVSGNQAGSRGGGIFNYPSYALELHDSTVNDNRADRGGGLYNAGTLILSHSTVSGNDAQQGGGINNEFGTTELISSTVSGNHASADGGGIHNTGSGSSVTVSNSTISSNSSVGGDGGGVWNGDDASMVLTNSTVTLNSSSGNGGGIHNTLTATLALNNSTVGVSNWAGSNGGGIWNDDDGTVRLKNSIVAGNGANSGGPDCHNAATLSSLDYNLMGDDSDCSFAPQPNDQLNVDPLLGSLQDNGGPTETRAPMAGSPAIDAVPLASWPIILACPSAPTSAGSPDPRGPTVTAARWRSAGA